MEGIERLIREAGWRVLPGLCLDELRARVGRRSRGVLRRPPRAWCLVVRAADRRITPWEAAIVPEGAVDARDARHPGRVVAHEVVVDRRLLERVCRPVEIEYGATLKEVGEVLGVNPGSLFYARKKQTLKTQYVPSARGCVLGNVRPTFFSEGPVDPGARAFVGADAVWGSTAKGLVSRAPEDFSQVVRRVPVYRSRTDYFEKPEPVHPEHPANDLMKPRQSKALPRPGPEVDYVWYKWRGDEYVGYDWRNPEARAGHERRRRRLEKEREANRKRYREGRGRRRSEDGGSLRFCGWMWECPGCRKLCKNLYLPVRPVNLVDAGLLRRLVRRGLIGPRSAELGAGEFYANTLACARCTGMWHLSRSVPNSWGILLSYLSGGLLYGREVPKPARWHEGRKVAYRPKSRRDAPRREEVRRRLLSGWSLGRIAKDLGVKGVGNHVRAICRQEGVKDRHELARKLKSPHAQALTCRERAWRRREEVCELLLRGKSYREIMAELELDWCTVCRDAHAIYRAHGVKGSGGHLWAPLRGRLAEKLGRAVPLRPVSGAEV